MTRVSAGLALFILPGVLAAPAVKGKTALYHPTKAGDKRVYEVKAGDKTRVIVNEVSKVEEGKDGVLKVTVLEGVEGGEDREHLTYEVSDRGVTRTPARPESALFPQQILRLPVREGESWSQEVQGPVPPKAGVARAVPVQLPPMAYTTGKEEEVEVPAGKFRAVRVQMKWALNGRDIENTYWHAPAIGVVKIVTKTETHVLKSFTPGR